MKCGPLPRLRKISSDKRNHEVHLPDSCSAVFNLKQCVLLSDERSTRLVNARKKLISMKKRQQKLLRASLCPTKRNHEVHLAAYCSAVFRLKQCVLLSDEVHTMILVSRKIECPLFGKIKTALKPYGIREGVLQSCVSLISFQRRVI